MEYHLCLNHVSSCPCRSPIVCSCCSLSSSWVKRLVSDMWFLAICSFRASLSLSWIFSTIVTLLMFGRAGKEWCQMRRGQRTKWTLWWKTSQKDHSGLCQTIKLRQSNTNMTPLSMCEVLSTNITHQCWSARRQWTSQSQCHSASVHRSSEQSKTCPSQYPAERH